MRKNKQLLYIFMLFIILFFTQGNQQNDKY